MRRPFVSLLLTAIPTLVAATMPSTAAAVDVLAVSDLGTRGDGGLVTFPIYDTDFPEWVKPKVKTEVGRVTAVVPVDGLAMVTWQPPENFAGGAVTFQVVYKNASKAKVEKTVRIDVPASPAQPIQIKAAPAVAAPDVSQVTLTWKAPPSGQAPELRQYVASASFGTMGPVSVDSSGTATAVWRRPASVKAPVMALITLVDAADPRRRGKVELPVQVAQSTSFTVPPDAKVSVQLGDDTIGPVQASPAGTVAFDLRLDPRVTEGRLTGRTPHGDDVEQVVALPNAAQPVVHFAPIPLPARQGPGTHSVPVAVATWTPPGQDATVVVPAVSSGTFKAGAEREDGWVVGRFVPGPTAGEVHVTAGEAKTTLSVEQGLLRARAEVTPTELKGTGRDVTFSATALGADNGEVADTVGMRVVDGTVTARPGRRGTITTGKVRKNRDAEHVVVLAEPPGSVAKVPVQAVVPWFVTVSDDTVVLRLAAVDNLGRAVAGVPVSLEAVGGSFDGLPDTLTTDGYGMAYARLSRPDSAVGVRATAGGRSGGAALAASGVSFGGGDPNWTVALDQWKAAAPTLVVGKKAPVAVAAAVPPPTEASDTPPEGAADSPARPTKPARSPTSGAAWLRAAAAFQGGAYSLTSTQADPTVGPLDVTIDEDGLNSGGLQAFVLAWVGGGPFGVEADFRLMQGDLTAAQVFAPTAVDLADPTDPDAEATSVATNVDSTTFESNAWDLRIGGRYRVDVSGPLSGYGLVQLHRQSAGLYLWDDGAVALVDSPMLGARLGVGGLVEAGPFWLDAQLAETFAPFPIRHELEARMHLNILPAVALHAGGGMAWRSMTFEVDSSEVAYSDDRSYFAVGLGTAIR